MSHVVSIQLRIKDLQALDQACAELGLERIEQDQYKWYGGRTASTELPAGFSAEDLGRCRFALRVKGNSAAYEIGVVESRQQAGAFELLADFWNGGQGLEAVVGKGATKLRQTYAVKVTEKQMRKQGLRITRSLTSDGKVVLRGRK
jgi:hypothetical protein